MKSYTDTWYDNFKEKLSHIQIEFDALFVKGKLDDYYSLKVDDENNTITLSISDQDTLPRPIEKALIDAFNQSKSHV